MALVVCLTGADRTTTFALVFLKGQMSWKILTRNGVALMSLMNCRSGWSQNVADRK